jgi:hypothetical protein
MNWWLRIILTALGTLIPLSLIGTTLAKAAGKTVQYCQGEYRSYYDKPKAPWDNIFDGDYEKSCMSHGPSVTYLPCGGESPQQVAERQCGGLRAKGSALFFEFGASMIPGYSLTFQDSMFGNKCGYVWYTVTCAK